MVSNLQLPFIFGQLKCNSNLNSNESPIHYEISSSISTFNCNGNKIAYVPNIGIDLLSGKLASFENFSHDKFCDSTFEITARIEDVQINGGSINSINGF